jgi:hypothetical protein
MQQQPSNPKTPSQIWLIHSLEVLFIGSLATAGTSIYSALMAGTLTWANVLTILGGTAGSFLFNGIRGTLLNAQTVRAVSDTLTRLEQSHSYLNGLISQVLPFLHTHPDPVPAPVPSPAPQLVAPAPAIPASPVTAQGRIEPPITMPTNTPPSAMAGQSIPLASMSTPLMPPQQQ